jgi:hypothetical protein
MRPASSGLSRKAIIARVMRAIGRTNTKNRLANTSAAVTSETKKAVAMTRRA